MAIMIVLAIIIDIYGYCDRLGHWNRHDYRDHIGLKTDIHDYYDHFGHRNRYSYRDCIGLETDMPIMTALAIETEIHLSGIEPGTTCNELVLGWLF